MTCVVARSSYFYPHHVWFKIKMEWPTGLRCCNKNRKDPGSNTTRCLAGLRVPTSLKGSQWHLGWNCRNAVINIRNVRLSPWKCPKVGCRHSCFITTILEMDISNQTKISWNWCWLLTLRLSATVQLKIQFKVYQVVKNAAMFLCTISGTRFENKSRARIQVKAVKLRN